MVLPHGISLGIGIEEEHREEAIDLYEKAFDRKFSHIIRDQQARRAVLSEAFNLSSAVSAFGPDGLYGLCGFHDSGRSLTGGITASLLLKHLGWREGLRASLIGGLLKRHPAKNELLMDGIAVSAHQRGRGIGTMMLDTLRHYARERGYEKIRLDVVSSNPGARKLYERFGFVATTTRRTGLLTAKMGFDEVTTMHLTV
jgi:ribosomal protein S18 acetylase RimI-like enzyme